MAALFACSSPSHHALAGQASCEGSGWLDFLLLASRGGLYGQWENQLELATDLAARHRDQA